MSEFSVSDRLPECEPQPFGIDLGVIAEGARLETASCPQLPGYSGSVHEFMGHIIALYVPAQSDRSKR